jgi:hypothetical protein
MSVREALGLIAVYGALVAAVLFILIVVVGELVIIARWFRRITRVEPPAERSISVLRGAGSRKW